MKGILRKMSTADTKRRLSFAAGLMDAAEEPPPDAFATKRPSRASISTLAYDPAQAGSQIAYQSLSRIQDRSQVQDRSQAPDPGPIPDIGQVVAPRLIPTVQRRPEGTARSQRPGQMKLTVVSNDDILGDKHGSTIVLLVCAGLVLCVALAALIIDNASTASKRPPDSAENDTVGDNNDTCPTTVTAPLAELQPARPAARDASWHADSDQDGVD